MSFGQRGGYNSGGTTGSGSSSQDAQKSPASRTSSKISYDSTGPHDERYYGTIYIRFLKNFRIDYLNETRFIIQMIILFVKDLYLSVFK